ncbi:helix-turn-helix domain-containing protein [Buttiauxella massiliensis]|uniref:helix-turn-helix domain-containing protein n=1 Tax=Buttiauxella massiliensis TaxID=2831590 RepID=UPI00125F76C9|nr:helix-turn-helix transcriptional regulator [Buttiauxella massiliensis]
MKKLQDVISEFSPEDQTDIWKMAQVMVLETGLQLMREELSLSQKQVAEKMGVSQPAIAAIEQRGNDLKLLTLKRYIEAMGGQLSLLVQLPEGNKVFKI